MESEFQQSIRRLIFWCRLPDFKIVWINPLKGGPLREGGGNSEIP